MAGASEVARIVWWEGAAGALLGAIIGSCIPLYSGWRGRRTERQGELEAMQAEMYHSHLNMEALLRDNVQAPLYRMPLATFERALPKLIGDGLLRENETAALIEYVMRIEELNHGLDLSGQAAAMNSNVAEEFNRNRLKVSRILSENLERLQGRTVFDAAQEALFRVEGFFDNTWRMKLKMWRMKLRSLARPQSESAGEERSVSPRRLRVAGYWCHWAAMAFEAFGALLVFLEARRFNAQIDAQIRGSGHIDYVGQFLPGFQNWWHTSGGIGFACLLFGIFLTGLALFLDHHRKPD